MKRSMNETTLSDEGLDRALSALPEPEPSAALMRRVAEIPLREVPRRHASGWWPFATLFRPLATWGAAGVMGVALGLSAPGDALDADASRVVVVGDGDVAGEDDAPDAWMDVALALDLDGDDVEGEGSW